MASFLAASTFAAKHRLPILMSSFCRRIRSSTCSFEEREILPFTDGKVAKATKIYGAPPQDLQQRLPRGSKAKRVPPGYVIPAAPCISETKYFSVSESEIKSPVSQPLPAQAEEATHTLFSDILIQSYDKDDHAYFTVYSIDEEDGSMSPKYYFYPPSPLKEKWIFLCATCNGVFHFFNAAWEHLLWNSTTDEIKTLPISFVERPLLDACVAGSVMWSSRQEEDYKLLQLLVTHTQDEEGCYIDTHYWIWWYSLKTNSWKKIPCTQIWSVEPTTSTCINGVYYCAAYLLVPEDGRAILSFDLSAGTLSTVPLPFANKELFYHILEYKGLLSIVVYSCLEDVPTKYELWVRNDGLWTRESVFYVSGVRVPIWFSKNGHLLYFESMNDEVVVFDRAVGKSKNLGIHCYSIVTKFYPFAESSVQLNGVSVVEELEEEEEEEEEEEDDDGYTRLKQRTGCQLN